MIGPQVATPAAGRPSAGHLLKQAFQAAAGKRGDRKDLRPLAELAPYLKANPYDTAMSVLFIVLSSTATLALTLALRWLVDHGIQSHSTLALAVSFVIAAAVAGLFALATAFRIYFVNKLGERVVVDLRKAVYDHVLKLDLAQVIKVRTGELLSRMTTDMTIVERMISNGAPVAIRCTLTLLGAVVLLLAVSPRFTGWVVVVLPLGLLPLFMLAGRLKRLSSHAQDRFAEAIGCAGEGLEGLETVLAFGQERAVAGQFSQALERAFAASRRFIRARVIATGLMICLIAAGILAVLYRCALAVFQHHMTPGVLLQLLMLSMLAASSARELGEVWGEIQKASGALDRISELMAWRPTIAAPARRRPMPKPARGEIEFTDVTFSYPGREDELALNGFSLKVRRGERVALVGPSGAGKSTVFRLLLRFYDPVQGQVAIDGVDLREADPREVRQRLVIARALVRDAPILLLDEATSALDAENERLVQQAMHQAMDGRTSIVIAHRLATVLEADRIVVMDRGRVVEQGSHAELLARDGLYARLARLQFAANAA